jgi:methyltransferase (TIGR00027 family)
MTESADWDVATGVGFTALVAASARAVETLREPAPLVRDPYAEEFVLAAQLPSPLPLTPEAAQADTSFPWPSIATYVGVRSRFFDEFFAAAIPARGPAAADADAGAGAGAGAGGARQVVILAAGLDTRAFRLDWPAGTRVFEVDAPRVLSFKDQVLADAGARPAAMRHAVPSDLREDWPKALRAAGLDPAAPTAWLAEGLFMYLTDEARAALLGAVHELSAAGSQIAIEHIPKGLGEIQDWVSEADEATDNKFGVDVTGMWPAGHLDDPAPWLAAHGWPVAVHLFTDVARRYGRPLPADLPEGMQSTVLITAKLA